MRSTLFFIPHQIAGFPLFGFGLLLALLVISGVVWLAWSLTKKHATQDLLAALPVWLVAAAIVTFVLPNVEMVLPSGEPIGLPIRGYGVLVLLGLVAGIGITGIRGQQLGIALDTIIGLGFWMMLGGIVGARLFYVTQKWSEFDQATLLEKLVGVLKLTEGGLVIYGGVLGGLVAATAFCMRHNMKFLATADLIAPGFLLGLALGRIGCLLHGCCFGGICTANLPTIQFPEGSGPYNAQLASGQLLGVSLKGKYSPPGEISAVRSGSLAAEAQFRPGQQMSELQLGSSGEAPISPASPQPLRVDAMVDGQRATFMPSELPDWSLPVHPSQIYACVNALLLCLLVWHVQPLPRRDGVAFSIAILLYALSRFLLEGIRSDEGGQLGTPFTIAQLVAIGSGLAAMIALLGIYKLPPGRSWEWPRSISSTEESN